MHGVLLGNQSDLETVDLLGNAEERRLDTSQLGVYPEQRRHAPPIAQDVGSADRSAVAGTSMFFVNGHRHAPPQDLRSLSSAIAVARLRALKRSGFSQLVAAGDPPPTGVYAEHRQPEA